MGGALRRWLRLAGLPACCRRCMSRGGIDSDVISGRRMASIQSMLHSARNWA
jgi:hypothetical protein